MLATVLIMALAVSVEPFRIGMTVLMLNRPRPALQLLAFLCGGFAMGMTVGLVVLFVFRRKLLGSSYFTLPNVQILIGLLALFVAVVVAVLGRWDLRPTRLARPAQQLLRGPSLVVAGVAYARAFRRVRAAGCLLDFADLHVLVDGQDWVADGRIRGRGCQPALRACAAAKARIRPADATSPPPR